MNLCNTYGLCQKVYAQKSWYLTGRRTRKKRAGSGGADPVNMENPGHGSRIRPGPTPAGSTTCPDPREKEIKVTVGMATDPKAKWQGRQQGRRGAEDPGGGGKANHGKPPTFP